MTKPITNSIDRVIDRAAEILAPQAKKRAKKLLLKKAVTLVELADDLGVAPKVAQKLVAELQAEGANVHLRQGEISISTEIPKSTERLIVDPQDFFDGTQYKFGVLGDTHLASKYARLDVLRTLYDVYEEDGINTVFHTGNIVDGEFRFNRYDLLTGSGIGPQVDYLIQEYPQKKGIKTKFITGNDHEGWWINREGINIGQYIQSEAEKAGRSDLEWIGHIERDIEFKTKKGAAVVRVMHPGGGSAYATSYTEQKIVEALQGGEKPHILFMGHYHKFDQGYPREVHTVQTGCTQDQTPFLRVNKIQVHVGGTEVSFHQADTGEINRLAVEWMPFYDKGFYTKLDKYRRW